MKIFLPFLIIWAFVHAVYLWNYQLKHIPSICSAHPFLHIWQTPIHPVRPRDTVPQIHLTDTLLELLAKQQSTSSLTVNSDFLLYHCLDIGKN